MSTFVRQLLVRLATLLTAGGLLFVALVLDQITYIPYYHVLVGSILATLMSTIILIVYVAKSLRRIHAWVVAAVGLLLGAVIVQDAVPRALWSWRDHSLRQSDARIAASCPRSAVRVDPTSGTIEACGLKYRVTCNDASIDPICFVYRDGQHFGTIGQLDGRTRGDPMYVAEWWFQDRPANERKLPR